MLARPRSRSTRSRELYFHKDRSTRVGSGVLVGGLLFQGLIYQRSLTIRTVYGKTRTDLRQTAMITFRLLVMYQVFSRVNRFNRRVIRHQRGLTTMLVFENLRVPTKHLVNL